MKTRIAPQTTRMGTVAIILSDNTGSEQHWVETFSDEREIEALEQAIEEGRTYPLDSVYEFRRHAEKEDSEFGDYVEELLSQRFLRPEIQAHGVAWLKSKAKIEQFREDERNAAEVIANYAIEKYKEDPQLTDFILAGPGVQVRVRIFKVPVSPAVSSSAA